MHVVGNVALVPVGVLIVIAVFDSALRPFVLPRGVSTTISRFVFIALRRVFDSIAKEGRSYEFRDRVMALYGPLSLFALGFFWMALVVAAFTLIYRGALESSTWSPAFELIGSSVFTVVLSARPSGVAANI